MRLIRNTLFVKKIERCFNGFFCAAATLFPLFVTAIAFSAPVIVSPPLSKIATEGSAVNFSIVASGEGTLTYQWKHLGKDIPGATQASFAIASAKIENSGFYQVCVGDASSQQTMSVFSLAVGPENAAVVGWGPSRNFALAGMEKAIAFAPGSSAHLLALRSDGSLITCGGSLPEKFAIPDGLSNAVAVATGPASSIAVKADGSLVMWGSFTSGNSAPAGLQRVVGVASGASIHAALHSDGSVTAWGIETEPEGFFGTREIPFVIPNFMTGVVSLAAGSNFIVGLRADGSVVAKKRYDDGTCYPPAGLTDVVAISSGSGHCLALKRDGSVVAWGENYMGNTSIPVDLAPVSAISATGSATSLLHPAGKITVLGYAPSGENNVPGNLWGVFAVKGCIALQALRAPNIAVSESQKIVLEGASLVLSPEVNGLGTLTFEWRRNGVALANNERISGASSAQLVIDPISPEDVGEYTLVVTNAYGQTSSIAIVVTVKSPPKITQRPFSRIVQLGKPLSLSVPASDSGSFTYEWKRNGKVLAGVTGATYSKSASSFQDEGVYEVKLTNAVASAFTVFHVTVTKLDVEKRALYSGGATLPAGLDVAKVCSLAAIQDIGVALMEDGTVRAFGIDSASLNASVSMLSQIVAIASGASHLVALRADGTIGIINTGSTDLGFSAGAVTNAVAVFARGNQTYVLKSDGTVLGHKGAGIPAGLSGVVTLAVGDYHALALKNDGTVVAWGSNTTAECDVPSDLADVVAIGARKSYSVALTSDGVVRIWGNLSSAQRLAVSRLVGVRRITDGSLLTEDGVRFSPENVGPYSAATGAICGAEGRLLYFSVYSTGDSVLTNQSLNYAAYVGTPARIVANFAGNVNAGTSIKWYKDGVPLPSQPGLWIDFEKVQLSDAGEYNAEIATSTGKLSTGPIIFDVVNQPQIKEGAVVEYVKRASVGKPVALSAQIENADERFQWKRNGVLLSGANTDTLSIASPTVSDSGPYTLVIIHPRGARLTRVFYLQVYDPVSTVVGWGGSYSASEPPPINGVVKVAGIGTEGLVLMPDGKVQGWGSRFSSMPQNITDAVDVAVGWDFGLVLKANGNVVAWGSNTYGQTDVPSDLAGVVAIAARGYRSIALKYDGTVSTWGKPVNGAIAVPADLRDVVAVAVGDDHYVALQGDGIPFVWGVGQNARVRLCPDYRDVTAVAAAGNLCFGIRSDGQLLGWGESSSAVFPIPTEASRARLVSLTDAYVLALGVDNQVRAWGSGSLSPLSIPDNLTGVTQLCAGVTKNFAVIGSLSAAPQIVNQPSEVAATLGQNSVLQVRVSGTPALYYSWTKDGVALDGQNGVIGASSASLVLQQVTAQDAGSYVVTVKNRDGSITSAPIRLVIGNPTITPSLAPVAGGSVTLSVSVAGGTSYQWRKNGQLVVGATNASLTFGQLSRSDNGIFDVVVSTSGGTISSQTYYLAVSPSKLSDRYQPSASFAPVFEQEGAGSIKAAVQLPDGKFLVGGNFTRLGSHRSPFLARLNSDGSVDTSFVAPVFSAPVHAIIRLADGSFYIAGAFGYVNGVASGGVVRLGSDFAVDSSFNVGVGFKGVVHALALQPDGKLLVGGAFFAYQTSEVFALARLSADGSLDTSFLHNDSGSVVCSLHLESDGRIVLGGYTPNTEASGYVRRIGSNGATDSTWAFSLSTGYVQTVARTNDGKWLVGIKPSSIRQERLVRLNADGSKDKSFFFDPALFDSTASVSAVFPLADGTFLASGQGLPLCRLDSSGKRDSSFAKLSYAVAEAEAFLPAQDGSVLCFGRFATSSETARAGFVPFNTTSGFGAFCGTSSWKVADLYDVKQGPGRTLYVRGSFTHVNDQPSSGIARLNRDGSLDSSFRAAIAPDIAGQGRFLLQGDGKLLVYSGGAIKRLLSDGSIDSSFSATVSSSGDFVVDRDGGIVFTNRTYVDGGISKDEILRVSAAGLADASFRLPYKGTVSGLLLRSDGRILLGSRLSMLSGEALNYATLYRLMPDGKRDTRFAAVPDWTSLAPTSGEKVFLLRPSSAVLMQSNGEVDAQIALPPTVCDLPDGRFVGAFRPGRNITNGKLLYRYAATGAEDSAFQVLDIDATRAQIDQLLVEDDGSLLLRGTQMDTSGLLRHGLLRLEEAFAPAITVAPVAKTGELGGTASFSVTAAGSGLLSYQWYRDGWAIPGATSTSLALSSLGVSDVGSYTVKITNSLGSVTSTPVALSSTRVAPVITTQPLGQTVTSGGSATFTAQAQLGAPGGSLVYQWRRQGFPIPGATGTTLTLSSVSKFDASFYDVLVSDGLSSVRSNYAELIVNPSRQLASYEIDTTFRTSLEVWGGSIDVILPAADGKYIVSGTFTRIGGVARPGLARVDAQLNVDPSFEPDSALISAKAFAVTSDGKVVVGVCKPDQPVSVVGYYLIRLLADGKPDPSFQPGSEIGNIGEAYLQTDGTLLAVPASPIETRKSLLRIKADGSLDPAFNVLFTNSGGDITLPPILTAPLRDGTILCYGAHAKLNSTTAPAWVRLNQQGQALTQYASPDVSLINSTISQVLELKDGRIFIVGSNLYYNSGYFSAVCLLPNNSRDTAFVLKNLAVSILSVFETASGQVQAVYRTSTVSGSLMNVASLTNTGDLEGASVFAVAPAITSKAFARVSDDVLLVGGEYFGSESVPSAARGRSFLRFARNAGVWSSTSVQTEIPAGVSCIGAAPGGNIFVSGAFTRVNGEERYSIARLFPDGSTDTSFKPVVGLGRPVTQFLVQPNGRVLLSNGIRLEANGDRDRSFRATESGLWFAAQLGEQKILLNGYQRLFGDGSLDANAVYPSGSEYAFETLDRGVILRTGTDLASGTILAENTATIKTFSVNSYQGVVTLLRRPDGSVLAGAKASLLSGRGQVPVVYRYFADGKRDTAFVGNMYPATTNTTNWTTSPRLYDLGFGKTLVNSYLGLYRLTATGELDSGFLDSGFSCVKPNTGTSDGVSQVLVMDDGRLLLGDAAFRIGAKRKCAGLLMLNSPAAPALVALPAANEVASGKSWSLTATLQPGSAAATAYQWFKNGVAIDGATNANFQLASVGEADAGVYSVRVTNAAGFVMSPGTRLALQPPQTPPSITQQPQGQLVDAGANVTFSVQASGTDPLSYSWEKNKVALSDGGRLSGCTSGSLVIASAQVGDGGTYRVKITNAFGSVTSDEVSLNVIPLGTAAAHTCPGWTVGGNATVTVVVMHAGDATRLSVSALIPEGWTYVSGSGEPDVKPKAGDAGALVWTFGTVPASPVTFSYTLAVPAGQSGIKSIAATASLTFASGEASLLVKPDPLVLRSLTHHSADTNNDWKISVSELTRVIQLYNTRQGTNRTGCYSVTESSSDGFVPDATRLAEGTATLARYHGADTDRNGRLGVSELTRVIQLYNTREGTNRTGNYHVRRAEDPSHLDGFSPGP